MTDVGAAAVPASDTETRQPRTVLLTLAYDGTDYVGWQRQPRGVSIQSLVEAALRPIEGAPVTVTGAGRTDAGVHALAQCASCTLTHPIPLAALRRALNARLPPDVRVLDIVTRPAGFNARFAATGKAYRYVITTGAVASPFDRWWAWHVPQALDRAAMADALAVLVGTHDFAAFQAAGSDVETTTRTITSATCRQDASVDDSGGARTRLHIDVHGTGFLRHMVRNIVGTVVEIGRGARPAGDLARVLASRDRAQAGPTAPARGLFLVRVDYAPVVAAPLVD